MLNLNHIIQKDFFKNFPIISFIYLNDQIETEV